MKGTTLTPAQRTLRARIGAYALHAQGGTSTAAATAAFLSKFVREVEHAAAERGEVLAPAEIERRAKLARREHFARLALASSLARSRKATTTLGNRRGGLEELADDSGSPRAA